MFVKGQPSILSYEECYGKEKAEKIKKDKRTFCLGKTFEQRFGNERAKIIKRKMSLSSKGIRKSPKTEFKKGHPPYRLEYSKKSGREISKSLKKYYKTHTHPKKGIRRSKEVCDKISKSKILRKKRLGFVNSPETRRKISIALKGKKLSENRREKIRKAGIKNWQDPKYQKKMMKSRAIKPTKSEQTLIQLIKENNFPFKYVGDYSFFVGRLNPDFIGNNGNSKKIIELFGDYYHGKKAPDKSFLRTEWGRKLYFKKHGYDCLVIWERELKTPQKVVEKIRTLIK